MESTREADTSLDSARTSDQPIDGQVGLGVDIVEIARMERIIERSPAFVKRVFSAEERAFCDSTKNPAAHYACRFAAREAVVKALGVGFARGINARDIWVKRANSGRPSVVLSGKAREIARKQGVSSLPISLSFTHTEAVACAMAITQSSQRAQQEREDPAAVLAQQFKEARAMLDDLDTPEVHSSANQEATHVSPDDSSDSLREDQA